MTINVSDENELEQLKKENDLLRRSLEQIKGTFTYHDQQLGLSVKKDENHNIEITRMDNHPLNDYGDLNESEGFLPAILDFVPHHIVFVDAKGIITFCISKLQRI
ncbi:hypothetical protein JOC75_002327 [Metabacillus crassostreae]|uniref:hypothetical protein n=1 Tax=Metabacillus crassostreae TaxID=929098 RepID=UPI001EF953BA|nr:hypothetical protein [Metabacillus crassostreae]MBM7604354.1 hypothetical protein [Metabacillus crassostreae]